MFETIAITTFLSVWTIERIYFYYYTKTNDDAILNLNTSVIPTPINNNLNTDNSLNVPLANSENAYYYTAPVYNLPNNENINQNNENQNNTINI